MTRECELVQHPDGSWEINAKHESGIVEQIPLPQLSKEQAVRETFRRGFTKVVCWDKTVMHFLQKGTVLLDKGTQR